ncbi:MAG TPA: type II toxin-antitoxin system PemK/MazF family toxin [Acidobacteriaceae bacterium]|nr:type II toxin-antitoxin system PemK/MazF family toxin [Acidobacteriaceae bacterium]
MNRAARLPRQGEIWWTNLPTDPPEKGRRPVVIVSTDGRNQHPRSNSVLVVPLSTSVHLLRPAHLLLKMGETGLGAESAAQADNITTVVRESLSEPRPGQRALSHTKVCELAKLVRYAMGCE